MQIQRRERGNNLADTVEMGECIYLVETGKRRRSYLITLCPGGVLQTARGPLYHESLAGQREGAVVKTAFGHPFHLFRPRLRDHMMKVKRRTQIIYPKDAGWLLLSLDVFPGARVIEMGTGSGAFTLLLARQVGPGGRVYTFDRRPEFLANALENVARAGLADRVQGELLEAGEPFPVPPVDAVFLDLPEPWLAIPPAHSALKPGRPLALIVPSAEQLQEAVGSLQRHGYSPPEVIEILERQILVRKKAGVRPADRMIGFTGYLVAARKLESPFAGSPEEEWKEQEDPGTELPFEEDPDLSPPPLPE